MDSLKVISALAAEAGRRNAGVYWNGVLDGVELVIDKAATEELTPEVIEDIRDFLALAREHAE